MNLLTHGPHACADWLLYKVRAVPTPIALHLEDDGALTARAAPTCKADDSRVGVYGRGVRYSDVVADLAFIRSNLTHSAASSATTR